MVASRPKNYETRLAPTYRTHTLDGKIHLREMVRKRKGDYITHATDIPYARYDDILCRNISGFTLSR